MENEKGELPSMENEKVSKWESVLSLAAALPSKASASSSENAKNKTKTTLKKMQKKTGKKKKSVKNPAANHWTDAQDKILKRRFKVTPNKWARIADHIKGRTGAQVRLRWELLEQKKNGKTGQWDPSEDKKLKKL